MYFWDWRVCLKQMGGKNKNFLRVGYVQQIAWNLFVFIWFACSVCNSYTDQTAFVWRKYSVSISTSLTPPATNIFCSSSIRPLLVGITQSEKLFRFISLHVTLKYIYTSGNWIKVLLACVLVQESLSQLMNCVQCFAVEDHLFFMRNGSEDEHSLQSLG